MRPADLTEAGSELKQELIAFCQQPPAKYQCPCSIDLDAELPRNPTGKPYQWLPKDL
ncbi:MAG TPA: hypothetical protein VF515_10255 [Candidatus Binatia bacterium]